MASAEKRKDHIFLSHSGADTQAAAHLAQIIRRNGFNVWMDQDNLQPGEHWMPTIEEAISGASAMVVYVGSLGIQSWVDREVRLGLVHNTNNRENFRFIPVLGEGADPAKLPPFVQQHQYVDLRDGRHSTEQIQRLLGILRGSLSSPAGIPAEYWTTNSPFRSLRSFSREDSWLFFGRDRDTEALLARLEQAPILTVIGNSGSGKSSLVQAGLIPALRAGRFRYEGKAVDSWRIAVFRPSAAPFDYLAEILPSQLSPELSATELAEFTGFCKAKLPEKEDALRNSIVALVARHTRIRDEHILLVADQFEELFTLVADPAIRSRYIDSLLASATLDGAVPVHLVLTLRADFYGDYLKHPKLNTALNTNLYNVPLMSQMQLRETIQNRLALAVTGAEAGLIDTLLTDVGVEPGNLALLEHALAQLWEKSGGSGSTLTNDAYASIGRLKGALGRHADDVYSGFGEADQRLVQKIFLELVQLGEGAQDTRRRVAKANLLHLASGEEVENVIAYLVSQRLLATSSFVLATSSPVSPAPAETFVEVSHEALIREWPTLGQWLKDNREDIRIGRLLLQSASEWMEMNRDTSTLMHGLRLSHALDWLLKHPEMPPLVGEFLKESVDTEKKVQEWEVAREKQLRQQAEARAAAEEMRRVAEVAAADQARCSALRSRRLSYALGALLTTALGVAWWAREEQLIAQSRELAAQAEQLKAQDQQEALDLAIRGWRRAKTAEANLAMARAFPQLVAKLEGHTGIVLHAAFSPDGQHIVTASEDRTARVWNATNGQLQATLEGHDDRVWQAEFSPDGQRIVTASADGTARLWSAAGGQLLAKLEGHTAEVWQAAFSSDGQRIVTASGDNTARVWNAVTGQMLNKLVGHTDVVWHAAFSSDGRHIVTASGDKTARVWNTANGQLLEKLEGHTDKVWHAGFSPDGHLVVTASWDNTARVWNADNGQLLNKLEGHKNSVLRAAFSPDGQRILTASEDKTARVWSATNGQELAKLEGHTAGVWHAAFSADGKYIVTASEDNTARVWNAANGRLLMKPEGHTAPVVDAEFSPDGQRLVTASVDTTARLWNAANGQLLVKLQSTTANVGHAEFSPDGKRMVIAGQDKVVSVRDADNGRLLVKLEGHTELVWHAAFSPDGRRIVTASSDRTARVWDAANGQSLAKLEGHTADVVHASYSRDGRRIITASLDSTARVWNATDGQLLLKLEDRKAGIVDAELSPDGQRIVTVGIDNSAQVWNTASGQRLRKIEGHTASVMHAEFSLDGQRIVTASGDKTARVWNASNGELMTTLKGHTDIVWHASFSPDGSRIVTASSDYTARIWDAANGQQLAKFEDYPDNVRHASFSPDGQRIVTSSSDAARVFRVLTLSGLAHLLEK
jgi:WD40 repeat protein/energy-coupling factor transporter ATP-binding protein EcfA2